MRIFLPTLNQRLQCEPPIRRKGELGRGGFGLTYLAEDGILNRPVVIKAPNRQFQADQEYEKFIRRFKREGQVLAKISHANVVQVIEFFQEVDIPCLVMAYVDGGTLNDRIRNQGQLSENEAVEIFRKLATALQTVHQVGLIHCDIHPGNIMLRRQSSQPVLIDFGSAKLLQPSTVTVTTTVNENYVPYEQGRGREPKPTLDVYALAATLYFAVTGEKPQTATNRIIDVAQKKPDPLKSPQQHQPGLSNWLNQAILKGMAVEPQDRPQSMQTYLGFLHPPQPKQRQAKSSSSQSCSEETRKKPQNQPHHSTFPFIPLGFVLLGYLPMGTLLWRINGVGVSAVAGAGAGVVLVSAVAGAGAGARAGAVYMAGAGAVTLFVAVYMTLFVAVYIAVYMAVPEGVVSVLAWSVTGAVAVAVALAVAVAWVVAWAKAVKSLKEHYNSRSIFIILGITSTLGLILGRILGWWLKLQGVSLPF